MNRKTKNTMYGMILANLMQHYIDELKLNKRTGIIYRWIFLYDSKENNAAIKTLVSRKLIVTKSVKNGTFISFANFCDYPIKGDTFDFHGHEMDIYTMKGGISPSHLKDLEKDLREKVKKSSAI
jgi:hypothetical protein